MYNFLQVILLVFLTMAALCVAGFLAYHLFIIGHGVTTYESLKGKEYSSPSEQGAVERHRSPSIMGVLRNFKKVVVLSDLHASRQKAF